MENMVEARAKMQELEGRLRERGVVDIHFFKTPDFNGLSELERSRQICEVVESVLEGRTTPFKGVGDSARLLGDGKKSPIMLSPVARCGGGHNGDHHEEQQKSGTSAS